MLYEVRGHGWCLPVEVAWHDVIAEIKLPKIPWLKKQLDLITDWLFANGEYRDEAWWVLKNRLEKVAVLSQLENPEDIVEWSREASFTKENRSESNDYHEPFIDGYVNSPWALITDGVVMELIWSSLKKYMLHLLVNERKPVDLFFCKLVPLLYRSNWKEIALRKEVSLHKLKRGEMYRADVDSIVKRGMAESLVNEQMTGYKGGVCTWTLEVIPLPPWERNTEKLEKEVKRSAYGNYVHRVQDRLKRYLEYALEVYSAYLAKASVPWVRIPEASPQGGRRRGWEKIRTLPYTARESGHVVLDPDLDKRRSSPVEETDSPLPEEMPVLQPEPSKLRDSREIPR